ncbi:hypothetical protein G7046_g156 [Stylonectria norvegica]|nr:hypothetical protein G7046_g156 [Stylonectria norvegica]
MPSLSSDKAHVISCHEKSMAWSHGHQGRNDGNILNCLTGHIGSTSRVLEYSDERQPQAYMALENHDTDDQDTPSKSLAMLWFLAEERFWQVKALDSTATVAINGPSSRFSPLSLRVSGYTPSRFEMPYRHPTRSSRLKIPKRLVDAYQAGCAGGCKAPADRHGHLDAGLGLDGRSKLSMLLSRPASVQIRQGFPSTWRGSDRRIELWDEANSLLALNSAIVDAAPVSLPSSVNGYGFDPASAGVEMG